MQLLESMVKEKENNEPLLFKYVYHDGWFLELDSYEKVLYYNSNLSKEILDGVLYALKVREDLSYENMTQGDIQIGSVIHYMSRYYDKYYLSSSVKLYFSRLCSMLDLIAEGKIVYVNRVGGYSIQQTKYNGIYYYFPDIMDIKLDKDDVVIRERFDNDESESVYNIYVRGNLVCTPVVFDIKYLSVAEEIKSLILCDKQLNLPENRALIERYSLNNIGKVV